MNHRRLVGIGLGIAATPLTGDLGAADLAVLKRYADPKALLKAGRARLTSLIATASPTTTEERATQWLQAAQASIELYGGHHAASFADLAAEVATEVRLLHAAERELVVHAAERERCYRWVDRGGLARSLPGLREVGGPAAGHPGAGGGLGPQARSPARPHLPRPDDRAGKDHLGALCVVAAPSPGGPGR